MKGKVRILFVTAAPEAASPTLIGGGERHLLSLATRLDQKRYEVMVAYPGSGLFEKYLAQTHLPAVRIDFGNGRGMRALLPLVRFLKRERIDLLHAYEPKSAFMGAVAAHLAGVRAVVLTFHLPIFPPFRDLKALERGRRWLGMWKNTLACLLADRVIAASEEIRQEKLQRQRVPASKVSTILNGVDPSDFPPDTDGAALREELGISPRERVVGVIARLEPYKGHRDLLSAAPQVLAQAPDVRFLCVGDGSDRAGLEAMARAAGLQEKVVFTGFRQDIPRILAAVDVVVHPSLDESTTLTLIEAMLMRKPLIATRLPSLAEMVQDGVNGWLVPPKDPQSLSQTILRLLGDPLAQQTMGRHGRKIALQRFTLDRMVGQTVNLYEELVRQKGLLSE